MKKTAKKSQRIDTIINEDGKHAMVRFTLQQKHFKDDLLDVLLIAGSQEFNEIFEAVKTRQEFLNLTAGALEKAAFIHNKAAAKDQREKMIQVIDESLEWILEGLADRDSSLDELINREMDVVCRTLLKWTLLFVNETLDIVKENKPEELEDWMEELVSEKESILNYLGFTYMKEHLMSFKLAKGKLNWLKAHVINYTDLYQLQQNFQTSLEKLLELSVRYEAMSKELVKKNKIIESKKSELLSLNDKLNGWKTKAKQNESPAKEKEFEQQKDMLEQAKKHAAMQQQTILELEKRNKGLATVETELSNIRAALEKQCKRNQELQDKLVEIELSGNSWQEYNLFSELELYLQKNKMTQELMRILEPYIALEVAADRNQAAADEPKHGVCFAYCDIDERGHFVVDPLGSRRPLHGVQEDWYLGQGQIIKIDEQDTLLEAYHFRYSDNGCKEGIDQIAILQGSDEQLQVETAFGELLPFYNATPYKLRAGQFVGLNSRREIIKIFCLIKFNADLFLKSALIRGQTGYWIEKVMTNGLVAIELVSGKSEFISCDCYETLQPMNLVFIKDGRTVKRFEDGRFYTWSTIYQKGEYGTVTVGETKTFLERVNGERRLVNGIPEWILLEHGDVIRVDEFFQFIERLQEQEQPTADQLHVGKIRKEVKNSNVDELGESESEQKLPDLRPERILIIGDEGMTRSYKLALYRSGYSAEVVSGVDSWYKIEKAVRQSDVIVFVTDHSKHQFYYKYKALFDEKKTLYAPFEGANRIVELLNKELEQVS